MSALAAVEGVQVKGEQGVLGHALDRERRFWGERSACLCLPPLYERAILQAMAVLTRVILALAARCRRGGRRPSLCTD